MVFKLQSWRVKSMFFPKPFSPNSNPISSAILKKPSLFNKPIVRVLLNGIGGFLLINTLVLVIVYRVLHFGTLLLAGIGIWLLLHGLFWQKFGSFLAKSLKIQQFWRLVWGIFWVWLLSFLLFVGFLKWQLVQSATTFQQKQDLCAIVILGTGVKNGKPTPVLASRLDKSAILAKNNPSALLVLTGGVGFNNQVSEASVMAGYLSAKYGLPRSRMALENQSTSTAENLSNTKAILASRGLTADCAVAVVTSDFHTLRAVAIAKKQGFASVTSVGADTPLYIRYHNWLREYFAFVSGWLLGEY